MMVATTIDDNIMPSSQARDGEMATSATRSTSSPWKRVRAKYGGAGGALPAAAPAASNRWLGRRLSAVGFVLGSHGTAVLP